MHSRVVHVHGGIRFDIYGGRGRCPCGTTGCTHMALGSFGNQWDEIGIERGAKF